MGNPSESVIFTVDVQTNLVEIAKLKQILADNKVAADALNAAFKESRISSDELTAGQARLGAENRNTQQSIGLLQRAVDAQLVINKAAAGSVDELGAKSKLLTAQYNALGEEQKKTAAGQALQADLKKTNDALKAAGASVGDFRRSVGDYNTGVKEVRITNEQLTGGLKTVVDKGLAPFQSTIDKGTGLFAKYKSGTELVKTGLAALKPAGETGAQGFKAVATGIAATGIGLLLIALTSVISYFTQTNEGGKILKQGLAGLGAVVTTVANLFVGAGKGLVEVFKNPQQALNSLLDFLKTQVINRLAAFGVLIDGIRNRDFKKITDSVIQFNLGITDGTDKAAAYARQIGNVVLAARDLEAEQQKLKKSRAQLEQDEILEKGRVEELIRLSKDRTLATTERLNKLREAGRLENELSAKSLKQLTDELNVIKLRNAAKGLSKTADEIQEEREKQKEYNATLVERNNTLAAIKARQSRFILEERAELKKAQDARAAAAQKAREDAIRDKITEQKRLLLTVQEGSAAELAVKQRLVQLEADLEIAGAKKTASEKALIQATANNTSQKLADEFAKKQIEDAKKITEAIVKEREREYAEAQKNLQDYLDKKRAAIEADQAAGLISENEAQKQLSALDRAGLQAELVNARDYGQKQGAIEKKIADNDIKEAKRVKDEKKKIKALEQQIYEAARDAALTSSDAVIEAFGAESDAGRAALVVKKTLALADIAIQTQKQIQLNHTTAAEIKASIPPPLGVALGIAYEITTDALSLASGAASAAKILGFNTGGIVPGGKGAYDEIPATLTRGEIVINSGVQDYPQFLPVLGALNQMVGGVNFAPGFTRAPASQIDGGLTSRALGNSVFPTAAEIGAAVGQNVPTSIQVDAINAANGRKQRARALTSLG